MTVQVNFAELRVTVIEIQLYITARATTPASDFSHSVFETLGQVYLRSMFIARYANNRFARGFTNPVGDAPGSARFHVHLELDVGNERLIDFVTHRGIDAKDI